MLFLVALIPGTTILRTLKQGNSFGKEKERSTHLLFIDDLKLYGSNDSEIDILVKVVKIVSGDNGMQFAFAKCAVLKMKRGKQVYCEGIDLGNGVKIEDIEGYKYLLTRESGDISQKKMKEKVQKEFNKRVRKVLKCEWNGGNAIDAINIWVVATVRYGVLIINWNKEELNKIEQQTWSLLNTHRDLHHPYFSVDRL